MNQTIKKRIEEINNGIVPEGYEKTSFGIFPCDWEKDKSLGDICEINPKTEALPNEFIYIDLESVVDGKLIQENVIENAKAPSRAQRVLQKNDIIYQMVRPYQKNNFIFIQDDGSFKYVASTGYAQLRSDNYSFLYQMVNSEYFCTQVLKKCTGTNYPAINSQDLAEVNCAYPKSDREQSRIAEILMQWDKAIELHEKLIEAYQKLKKYYLKKMFPKKGSNIPEIRFPGFTAPWEQRKLGDVVSRFATGLNPRDNFTLNSGGKNYYVTIKNFTHGNLVLDDNCDKIDDEALALIQARSDLRIGDILFSSIGRVGDCFLIENRPINWNINESVFVLRPVKDAVDPLYLMHTIHSERVLSVILSCVTGSTFKSIKMAQLKETNIPYPNIVEQKQIGKFITAIDNLITLHQQKRDKLLKQRKAMQQYLLTGIVRV